MLLKLTTLLIFSWPLMTLGRAPSTYYQLKTDLNKVSQKELVSLLNSFVQESAPTRMVGAPGHEKARDFLVTKIKSFDVKQSGALTIASLSPEIDAVKKFYQNDFDQKVEGKIPNTSPDYQKYLNFTQHMQSFADKNSSQKVENIIWEKAGLNSKKVLVVTAHYDTISHDPATLFVKANDQMPGANYNASGVSVALALIKTLSQIDLNYSVQVVFLDWQGIGFHGSYLHAKELKKAQRDVMGVINLEMLGQDTSFIDKTKKIGNMSLYLRDQADEKRWVSGLVSHGEKLTNKVSFEIKPNGFESSDNFRYWEQGFFSATFSQNWEEDFNPKFYQTPADTPETLNHETLYASYQYVGGAVIGTLLDLTK